MANTSVSAEIVVLEQAPTEVLIVTVAERGASSVEAVAIHAADPAAHGIAATVATAIAAHSIDADPHAGYALEADLGTAAFLDAGTAGGDLVQVQAGGKLPALDGSDLINLPSGGGGGDLTQAAADMLYAPIAKGVTNGDAHNHDGGDGAQIAYASLSGLPTLGSAAAAATGDFEAAGAVSTHNAVATAHGISAWGATIVDDADANTARGTLGLGTAAVTASTAYEASGAVSAHAGGTGVHTIAGVTGLQGALDAKAPTASPTFSGTVSGITAAMVGAPTGSGTSTGTNTGDAATPAETTTTIGALLNAATSKATPVDADHIGLMDSAASNIWKKLSWANLKTALYTALFGTASPSAKVHITNTTEQLRCGYDAANYLRATVNASGDATFGTASAASALTIKSNGNVGIGTTNPGGKLDVYNASSGLVAVGGTTLTIENSSSNYLSFLTAAGNKEGIIFGVAGASSVDGAIIYNDSTTTRGMQFRTGGNNTRMVIDSAGNVGIGATSPSARLHAIDTTEQLRLGYDAANYLRATVNATGDTTYTMVGSAPAATWAVSDATTNAIYDLFTLSKNSSGTGAAGIGVRLIFAAKSSTTDNTRQASIASKALVATHASRTNQITLNVSDYAASREGFCAEADGSQIKTSVNGVAAVARAAALTAEIPGDATRDELRLTELYNACKAFGIIN